MTTRPRNRPQLVRAAGSWRRFVAALAALAVVAVGIPFALAAVSQLTLGTWHPVPGVGSADEIRTWLSRDLSSSEIAPVALRVLFAAAWLLWVGLLTSVLSSIVTSRPSLERVRLPRLAMFDGLGGWIAAGLTALSSLTPNVAHSAPIEPVPVVEVAAVHGPAPVQSATRPVTGRDGWVRVELGESIEMFTARTLGDAGRWPEIWSLNEGRVMDTSGTTWVEAWRLGAGWELQLPASRPASRPATAAEPGAGALPGLHLVSTDLDASLDAAATNGHLVDVGLRPAPEFRIELPSDPPVEPALSTPPAHYVVVDGDSYWRIAERTLTVELGQEPTGAEVLVRTRELIGGNAERLGDPDDPHMLHTGDVVYLTAAPAAPPPASTAAGSEYVVRDGDSYWRIAERTLLAQTGADPTESDVLVRTHELIGGNAERLGDPDDPHMLHTGDVVYLTAGPSSSPLPASADPATSPPLDPVLAPTPAPDVAPPKVTPPPPRQAPTPAPTPQLAEPQVPAAREVRAVPAARPAVASTDTSETAAVPAVGVLAGMSTVACAGLAATWALRRRRASQRARPHQRPAPIAEDHRAAVADVVYRDVSDVTWMAGELRLLAHQLAAEARAALTVQLVQLDGTGRLEVAFDEIPAAVPPAGWCAAAERVWRLDQRHDDAALAEVADAPPILPALASLGDSGGSQLLINLEATVGINLSGDEALVTAWLTNVMWEVAGGALGERPSVILVDVDIPGADQLTGVTTMTGAQAAALVAADSDTGDVAMLQRRVSEWEAWPPIVVILGCSAVNDDWTALAARPAVAVIAVNDHLPGGLSVVASDAELTIPAWRLRVPATTLDTVTAGAAVDILAAADTDPVDDDLAIPAPTADTPLDPESDTDWEPPVWPVTVNLLGEPFATRNSERLALSPQVLSMLAYLAVQRDVSVDEFKEAMWGGTAVKDQRVRDLLFEGRKAAGGRSVVSYVEDSRVRAGPDLGVDLDVFQALNTRAQQAPIELTSRMHEIMYLVRGQPFSYPASAAHLWLWVDHPEHLQAVWGLRVSTVAWELAGLYLDRHDPGAARDIAERGLIADPLNAALTERLMEAYAALNAVEAAQRVYESHDRALTSRGFDGASEETRRVLERLRAAHLGTVDVAVGS